jgi:hypothetical protein
MEQRQSAEHSLHVRNPMKEKQRKVYFGFVAQTLGHASKKGYIMLDVVATSVIIALGKLGQEDPEDPRPAWAT